MDRMEGESFLYSIEIELVDVKMDESFLVVQQLGGLTTLCIY